MHGVSDRASSRWKVKKGAETESRRPLIAHGAAAAPARVVAAALLITCA